MRQIIKLFILCYIIKRIFEFLKMLKLGIKDLSKLNNKSNQLYWLFLLLTIIFIKFIIFCIDPIPRFFLGDSWSYLSTAINNWIPPDRSFIYGFIIKYTAIASHSLTTLISIQIATSCFNAIIISYILITFFSFNFRRAFLSALICTLEPLQLMYERFVMTEAFSLFLFTIYILIIFLYFRKPRLLLLVIIQIIGTCLISLRLSYLPIVLINTLMLPILALFFQRTQFSFYPMIFKKYIFSEDTFKKRWLISMIAFHILVSVLSTFIFHLGYKNLNGYLSKNPPAYQYKSGTIMMVAFLPVVEQEDFPIPEVAERIFKDLNYDPKNHYNRVFHHWQSDGIIARLNEAFPDSIKADNLALKTALNALKRDPFGVISVIFKTFKDFWNLSYLKRSLLNDEGDRPLPEYMLKALKDNFNLDGEKLPFLRTLIVKYHMKIWFWYLFLLCLPFFAFLNIFIYGKDYRILNFFVFYISFLIVLVSCTFCEGVTVRYLHSLGWIVFLVIGPMINILLKQKAK